VRRSSVPLVANGTRGIPHRGGKILIDFVAAGWKMIDLWNQAGCCACTQNHRRTKPFFQSMTLRRERFMLVAIAPFPVEQLARL